MTKLLIGVSECYVNAHGFKGGCLLLTVGRISSPSTSLWLKAQSRVVDDCAKAEVSSGCA